MSVRWEAPCGCVVEFDGQVVDLGETVKERVWSCARHAAATVDGILNDCKLKNGVLGLLDGLEVVGAYVYYEDTGPLKVRDLPPARFAEIKEALENEFGAPNLDIA